MARSTRSRVSGLTRSGECSTFQTVCRETPADRPMLAIVGPPVPPGFESATATSRDVIDQTCH
jgi:hypothetical protein